MTLARMAGLPLVGFATLLVTGSLADTRTPAAPEAARCTLVPGETQALLRVERDTMLPFAPAGAAAMSLSGLGASPADSLLAMPGTLMPAARVRLLQVDSTTRAALAEQGITATQPTVFLRAAPYRADCRTIRWLDTVPFVERGEIGYVRATLSPPEQWVRSTPVLIVNEVWNYPYPRRRSLAFGVGPEAQLASADAMFSLSLALETPRGMGGGAIGAAFDERRATAIAWARAHPASADLEPVRSMLRSAILDSDWRVAARGSSRLRGTYRVELDGGGRRHTWFFRTHDRPGYPWRGADSLQTIAGLLAAPHISGYRLVGYAGGSADSLPTTASPRAFWEPLAWLSTDDRPTVPDNAARRTLTGRLAFQLSAVPESLWSDLELFIPAPSPAESVLIAQRLLTPGQRQLEIPLTIRLDTRNGIRADTTLIRGGRQLRVVLERMDTLSNPRPF